MSPTVQSIVLAHDAHTLPKRSVSLWVSNHLTLLNSLTFILFLFVFFAFIVQVNNSASKGYVIRDLEKKIEVLTRSNQQTELEIQQAQSLGNIQRVVKMIGMVPSDQVVFVDAKDGSVAFAK